MADLRSIPAKQLYALINGVIQQNYFHEDNITLELLKEHIFSNDESTTISQLSEYATIIREIIDTVMHKGLTTQLTEITSILETNFQITDAEQQAAWLKIFKEKGSQLFEFVCNGTRYAPSLRLCEWRVDSLTNTDGTTTTVAIVKLIIKKPNGEQHPVLVEMGMAELQQLNQTMGDISQQLQNFV